MNNKTIPPDIAPLLQDLRRRLQEYYGGRMTKMVLFGSRARGDNAPDADIDVMVVLNATTDEIDQIEHPSDLVYDFWDSTGFLLGIIEMDENRFRHRNGPLLRNIRREGVYIE